MEVVLDFPTALRAFMARAVCTNSDLARLTGISVRTIEKWTAGEIRRPRFVTDVLKVARALTLDERDASALLGAAGHPPLAVLRAQVHQRGDPQLTGLLASWDVAQPSAPDPSDAGARAGPPAGAARRHQLRPPIADFVGRASETAQLIAMLRAAVALGGGAIISGVHGMGGIGKTELAYRVAHQLREAFPDAQLVVELRGSSATPLTAAQALQAAIRAITPDVQLPENLHELQQHYCSVLHKQRALILADDASDAAQVRPLIPPAGCALLITSRQRFMLAGMARVDLEQLREGEAVALLCGICERLSTAEAQVIARACGALPLALRVSGAILYNDPALNVATYIQRLADARQGLSQLRDPDDPQLDVAASLALSYARLDGATQQLFRQLGVMAADFATPLALAVIAAPSSTDVEQALHLLLRRNLLMYDATRERWRLHDLVRALARRYLEEAGELEATAWRYAHYAVQLAQGIRAQYMAGGDDMLAALARFDAERAHIDAARGWLAACAGMPASDRLLVDDAIATYEIGELRYDRRREYIPQLECAIAAAQRLGDQRGEGQILNSLGATYDSLGDARRAIAYYEQARAIARALGDRRGEGRALNDLGLAYLNLGETRQAIPCYEQALAIAREIGYQLGEGSSLGSLGIAYAALGDAQQAIRYYEQHLAIARALGDRRGEGITLVNLGEAALMAGDIHRAHECCTLGLEIARVLGDRRQEGVTLVNLGEAALMAGDTRRAHECCTLGLELAQAVGGRREEGLALSTLGRIYGLQGDTMRAAGSFEQALGILHEVGDRWGSTRCGWHFGLFLAGLGERERAVALLRACVAYEREIGHANAVEHAALLARLEVSSQ